MSEHLEADYSELLKTYKEPTQRGMKIPYTLWGRIAKVNGERKPDLAELRLIASHKQMDKAVEFSGWGWKLLKYWIPAAPSTGKDDFKALRGLLNTINSQTGNADLIKELEAERAKNKVLENKVKKDDKN
jgi:hypothetical protein